MREEYRLPRVLPTWFDLQRKAQRRGVLKLLKMIEQARCIESGSQGHFGHRRIGTGTFQITGTTAIDKNRVGNPRNAEPPRSRCVVG